MAHHITAYCKGPADNGYYDLTDWNGRTILELNDSRITVAETYRLWDSGITDKSYAVVYRLPNNRGWIVGYSLGAGCLFRGEYLENPTRSHCDMDTSDAERYAKQVAEYWIERDNEDDIAFQEEMRLEWEEEEELRKQEEEELFRLKCEEELNSWEDVIR